MFNLITRYFGSKTWSIPEMAIKGIPNLISKYIFKRDVQWQKTGYQWKAKRKETEITKHLPYYFMANVPQKTATENFEPGAWVSPFGYEVINPKDLGLNLKNLPGHLEIYNNAIIDIRTGFKAAIAYNSSTNRYMVGFGAMGSLENDVDEEKQNHESSLQKWAGIWNIFGVVPQMYEQADALIAELKKNREVVLSGSCLGGSLAQYAALKNSVKAFCINSIPLGAGLQTKLTLEQYNSARTLVRHISVEGDYVSDSKAWDVIDRIVSFVLGLRMPGNLGKRFTIPAALKSTSEIHLKPFRSVMKVLDRNFDADGKMSVFEAFNAYIVRSRASV